MSICPPPGELACALFIRMLTKRAALLLLGRFQERDLLPNRMIDNGQGVLFRADDLPEVIPQHKIDSLNSSVCIFACRLKATTFAPNCPFRLQ